MKRIVGLVTLTLVIIMLNDNQLPADEGLWLFNNPPKAQLKAKYNFDQPQSWYDHVQKSSVRFNSGGSGSFISADGLVMTNHHVGLGALQKLSKKGKDYVKDGFHAKTLEEEFKSVDE
jgi:S1-C subfamily serine protease